MVSASEKGNHPVILARINRTDLQTELFIMSENSVLYRHIIWTIAATAIPKKIIEGTGQYLRNFENTPRFYFLYFVLPLLISLLI